MTIVLGKVLLFGVLLSLGSIRGAPAHGPRLLGGDSLAPVSYTAIDAAGVRAKYNIVTLEGSASTRGSWEASNLRHALRASFATDSVRIGSLERTSEQSLMSLELVAWGCEGCTVAPEIAQVVVDGPRLEYRRGSLVEWYVNEPVGIEQGFTIASPPKSWDPDRLLELEIAVGGALRPELALDGQSLSLRDARGVEVLTYSKLLAWDSENRLLATQMRFSNGRLSILTDTAGASWPITVDPIIATEQSKLTALDAVTNDRLGYSVAVSGDTAIVGAPFDTPSGGEQTGSAYVFVRNGSSWSEQAKLTPPAGSGISLFGFSVALDGETAVVGAPGGPQTGSAFVFVRNGTNWSQQAKLN